MKFFVLICSLYFFTLQANASSYSACEIMGVVEDVYYNKINFRPLKYEAIVVKNYDTSFHSCAEFKGKVISLYDNSDDAVNEPCDLKLKTGFQKNKYRNRWKDNVQKGDMLTFDYTFYQSMTPRGGMCIKDWTVKEHVPLHPHSR